MPRPSHPEPEERCPLCGGSGHSTVLLTPAAWDALRRGEDVPCSMCHGFGRVRALPAGEPLGTSPVIWTPGAARPASPPPPRPVTLWGESRSSAEWLEAGPPGLSLSTLKRREMRGWSRERSLAEPVAFTPTYTGL